MNDSVLKDSGETVFGFGVNDATYPVCRREDGGRIWCPYYRVWTSMLCRCYSERHRKSHPTYIRCKVSKKWRYFSKFKFWMEIQDWKGKQLDKDFLGDGKLYSPETCCFVPGWLNNLFTGNPGGIMLPGVQKSLGRFRATFIKNGKRKNLGNFDTEEEAHLAYLKAKKQHVHNLMKDYPDQQVKEAVLRRVR